MVSKAIFIHNRLNCKTNFMMSFLLGILLQFVIVKDWICPALQSHPQIGYTSDYQKTKTAV